MDPLTTTINRYSNVAVPAAHLRFPIKRLLARVSRQSHRLANDKNDNEANPGAVHGSPGIYLTVGEDPSKYHLGDRSMGAMRPVIALNGVPYF